MRRFLFLWGVVVSAFLFSCSKETPLPSTEAEETIYQKVGRIHNEALDYVLDYIKRNKGSIMTRSGQPLSGIMVRVQDKCLFDWTDAQGEYGLWCKISDMIVISADGYQTLSIPGEVYLNPEPPKAILWPEQGGHFYLREMIIADASVAMAGAIESALGIAASTAITGGGSLFVLAGPAVSASLLAAVGFALHFIATE